MVFWQRSWSQNRLFPISWALEQEMKLYEISIVPSFQESCTNQIYWKTESIVGNNYIITDFSLQWSFYLQQSRKIKMIIKWVFKYRNMKMYFVTQQKLLIFGIKYWCKEVIQVVYAFRIRATSTPICGMKKCSYW